MMLQNRHSSQRGSTEILIGLAVLTAAGIMALLFQYMATQRLKSSVNQLNALAGLYNGELVAVSGYFRCFVVNCADSTTGFNAINLSYYPDAIPLDGPARSWASLFSGFNTEAFAERSGSDNSANVDVTKRFVKQKTLVPRYRPGTVGLQRNAKIGGKTVYCGVTKYPHTEERNCIEIKEPPVLTITVGGTTSRTNFSPGPTNTLEVKWTATNSTTCKVDAFSAPLSALGNKTSIAANSQAPTAPLPLPGGNTYQSAAFSSPRTRYTFELSCVSDIPSTPITATVDTGDPLTATLTVAAFDNPAASKATALDGTPQSLTWNSTGATECKMKSTQKRFCPRAPAPDPEIAPCSENEEDFADSLIGSNAIGRVVGLNRTNQNTMSLPKNRTVTYTLTCSNPPFSTTASVFIQTYELVSVYRAYNPRSACHFFTNNQVEYNQVTSGQGYLPEGARFKVFKEPFRDRVHPIYRLYNTKCHYYTISGGEKDSLVRSGWREEGIIGYAFSASGIPLDAPERTPPNPLPDPAIDKLALIYHLYNANSFGEGLSGDHIFVPSDAEARAIITPSTVPPIPPSEWIRQNHLGFAIPANPTNPVYNKIPMYRFLLPSGYHFFTTRLAEGAPYTRENNDFCVYADSINDNLSPLIRLAHPNGTHLLTPSRATAEALVSQGWIYEKVFEGYAFPGTVFTGTVVRRYFQTSNGDQLYSANGALGLPPPWRLESDTFTGTAQSGGACP